MYKYKGNEKAYHLNWNFINRERRREINRKSEGRAENKQAKKDRWNKWYQKNKEVITKKRKRDVIKNRARRKFYYHISVGNIKKLPCSKCGNEKVEGHHPNYAKPLQVIWLCRKHHSFIHRK